MFILLPVKTSIQPRRTSYVNYALITANVIVFLFTYWPHRTFGGIEVLRPWARQFMLIPLHPFLWQFLTYAFLHGSILHIVGNMFFLYLFGNNVNDKLGNIGYLCFYLVGAVFSGIGHSLVSTHPILGASGAVAAVTGAYLVLFPQTLITVFYWLLFFIGTTEVPALYFIGFKLIFWDNIAERRVPNVAYDAHLSGYVFGILATLIIIAVGLVRSTGFDLWATIKQWNRRRCYRDVVSSGYDPFTGQAKKWVQATEVKSPKQKLHEQKVNRIRSEIADRVAQHNLSDAAQKYLELLEVDDKQILPRHHLLDIANQLASEKKNTESAQAYEQFFLLRLAQRQATPSELRPIITYPSTLSNKYFSGSF